jgi:hypothetical protein
VTDGGKRVAQGSAEDRQQDRDWDPVELDAATPPAEWAIAAVGAVLACAVIALLVVQNVRGSDRPPQTSSAIAG